MIEVRTQVVVTARVDDLLSLFPRYVDNESVLEVRIPYTSSFNLFDPS